MNIRNFAFVMAAIGAIAATTGCGALPSTNGWGASEEKKAQALFKSLCETQAYEKIYKTVADVDGYLWVSPWARISQVRTEQHAQQLRDRNLPAAADYCGPCLAAPAGLIISRAASSFVELADLPNSQVIRVTPDWTAQIKAPVILPEPTARYMVSFSDLGTDEMRQLWIGASKLLITDRTTGELLAERVSFVRGNPGFLIDPTSGPWIRVLRCSNEPQAFASFTRKVLVPKGVAK